MQTSDIQTAFKNFILNQTQAEELKKHFANYTEEELAARLLVYKNNYYKSLQEALSDAFPTILGLLGEDFFNATANQYFEAFPPKSGSLLLLGESFPRFLTEFPHTQSMEYLEDTAIFDWSRHYCYHAKNTEYMQPESFAEVDPSELMEATIEPLPAHILLTSKFAFYSIWELNNQPESQIDRLDVNNRENALIIRKDLEIEVFKLHDSIFNFLQTLKLGAKIGESLEQCLALDSDFDASHSSRFFSSVRFYSKT